MNPSDKIISKQIEWALNRNLKLIGSHGNRGRKVYTISIKDNLFRTMKDETKKDLLNGYRSHINSTRCIFRALIPSTVSDSVQSPIPILQ